MKKAPHLTGVVRIQSNLSLEELGSIISQKIFGGLPFGGKELEIHEEVPAIFINGSILGLSIVLDGYPGFDESNFYDLTIFSRLSNTRTDIMVRLDDYLFELLKSALTDIDSIQIKPL